MATESLTWDTCHTSLPTTHRTVISGFRCSHFFFLSKLHVLKLGKAVPLPAKPCEGC